MSSMWALVILSVVTMLMVLIARQMLDGRQWLKHRQHQMQATWLARAGIEIAAARLLKAPDEYRGEALDVIPGSRVEIAVRPQAGSADTYLVTSEARYPTDEPRPVLRTHSLRFRRSVEQGVARLEALPPEAPPSDQFSPSR